MQLDDVKDNMNYIKMRYNSLAKIRAALESDIIMLAIGGDRNDLQKNDKYNKYISFVNDNYDNTNELHDIIVDVFNCFRMIAFNKYADYFHVTVNTAASNKDVNYNNLWQYGEDVELHILTSTVFIEDNNNYDSIKKLLDFDFESFIDNYFSSIIKFMNDYNIKIYNSGNSCILSCGNFEFWLNNNIRQNMYEELVKDKYSDDDRKMLQHIRDNIPIMTATI